MPELNYEQLLTTENIIQTAPQNEINKNFNTESRDNSIMHILCTIGEDKKIENNKISNNPDTDLIREKKESSIAISPKINANNHWKNSSLITNPSLNNNNNINNEIIKSLAINLKSSDLVTPKNFQNKFVLLDSGKEINSKQKF